MSAAFDIVRGDDFSIEVTITDENGDAIDLTDTEVFFTAKRNTQQTDEEAALQTELTDHSDPTNGITIVSFTADETSELKPGTYWWDIQTKKDGIIQSTILQTLRVRPDVTRRIEDAS
jgi:hypothetical protein